MRPLTRAHNPWSHDDAALPESKGTMNIRTWFASRDRRAPPIPANIKETQMNPTATDKSRMVTGLFPDRTSAERAYESVSSRGYSKDDVNLLVVYELRW